VKRLCLFGFASVLIFMSCSTVNGQLLEQLRADAKEIVERERHAQNEVFIAKSVVSVPIGRFLLIRRGDGICAVRFTKMYRGGDAHPPSIFSTGEESLYADYDWYYSHLVNADFTSVDTRSGHETASEKAPVGIGRFAFGWGSLMIEWSYPNIVAFKFPVNPPKDYELAPTKWQEIQEVNLNDPHLIWYAYDEKREAKYIPIDKLW
jgi:hypothetical protein